MRNLFGHFVDRTSPTTLVPMLWDLFGHLGPGLWALGFIRALGARV